MRLRPKHNLLIPVLAVFLALACAGCKEEKTGSAMASPPPPPVTVAPPLKKSIVEWDEYTGRFEAVQVVDIRARVSGYLDSIHFKDGDIVRKGDLLFVIDPRPFQATADAARAQLAQAKAQVELANINAARATKLSASGLAITQEQVDTRIQNQRVAQAAVQAAEANLRSAELNLEFTQVRAPIPGRVSNRRVDIGNLVSGGSVDATLLTTIVSLDPIYFVFDASELDYLRYQRLSQSGERPSSRETPNPVFVQLQDETGWKREGKMNFVDNQINPKSGTMRGRAIFDNPDYMLTPGQFGRLRLIGSGRHEALLIPDEAIVSDQSRKLVMTVAGDGSVQPRVVTLGPLAEGLRIVRQGLGAEDRLVIDGIPRARPGAKVTPQPGLIEARAE